MFVLFGECNRSIFESVKYMCSKVRYIFLHLTSWSDVIRNHAEIDFLYIPKTKVTWGDLAKTNVQIILGPDMFFLPEEWELTKSFNHAPNTVYLLPSPWMLEIFKEFNNFKLPIRVAPFPIKMFELSTITKPKEFFIYFKDRSCSELAWIETVSKLPGWTSHVLVDGHTSSETYKQALNKCRFGIWFGRAERQGFKPLEALAANVPLFVYDLKSLHDQRQEFSKMHKNKALLATSVPYFDVKMCGKKVYDRAEFTTEFPNFVNSLADYRPRDYVLKHFSAEDCFTKFTSGETVKVEKSVISSLPTISSLPAAPPTTSSLPPATKEGTHVSKYGNALPIKEPEITVDSEWWSATIGKQVPLDHIHEWQGNMDSASRKLIRETVMANKLSTILDVGCGMGVDYQGYKRSNLQVSYQGVDISKKLVALAPEGSRITYATAYQLPFPNSSFEVVTCRHLLEYLADYQNALKEMLRVAIKSVIIVFFIRPDATLTKDELRPKTEHGLILYHNLYSRSKLHELLTSYGLSWTWQDVPTRPNEEMLHIRI